MEISDGLARSSIEKQKPPTAALIRVPASKLDGAATHSLHRKNQSDYFSSICLALIIYIRPLFSTQFGRS
jgi:hypothetical protein